MEGNYSLTKIVLEKTKTILIESFSNITIAAIILILGIIIAQILGRLTKKSLEKIKINVLLKESLNIKFDFETIIPTIITYTIYFYFLLLSLSILGLNRIILSIIGIITLIIIFLSTLLFLRDLLPNIIVGIEIHKKKLFEKNDIITFEGEKAKIKEINLLNTIIEKKDGEKIILPNSIILKKEITVETKKTKDNKEEKEEESKEKTTKVENEIIKEKKEEKTETKEK